MKATIKSVGEYGTAGIFRLKVEMKEHCDFGCDDYRDPEEVVKVLGGIQKTIAQQT